MTIISFRKFYRPKYSFAFILPLTRESAETLQQKLRQKEWRIVKAQIHM